MSHTNQTIEIDPAGDIFLEVTEYDYSVKSADDKRPVKQVVRFKVSKEILTNGSQNFKSLLDFHYRGSSSDVIKLDDETVLSSEVWLRYMHGKMIPTMYQIPIKEVWHVIAMGRKRFLENEKLNSWFACWMRSMGGHETSNFTLEELTVLMYPCEEFEHAYAFAEVTRRLAYGWAGHIWAKNPLAECGIYHLHLANRFMAAVNDARTGLKSKIHNPIWAATALFLESYQCSCKEKTHYEISKSLHKTRVWPLEKHFYGPDAKSSDEILEALKDFKYTPPAGSCANCRVDFKGNPVNLTIQNVRSSFHGLCLDCINTPSVGSIDEEARRHRRYRIPWDEGCTIRHGQPTWWYSALARSHGPDAHRRERDERRRLGKKTTT
ncbi:hypothetical protein PVAG01_05531 [Phlyctema vagabunda]|uniref:BTB domain-containing protein n=1 Tax=Phlyctema vagabunda TaxID=108571 RepID=A0ABR4PKA6_9HELO